MKKREKKQRKKTTSSTRKKPVFPSEQSEQISLASILDAAGLWWFAVPNGGSRGALEGTRLEASGVKSGVPDLIIITPAPGAPRGVALELKRGNGTMADVRPEQWLWLGRFQEVGLAPVVGFGWRDAVARLRALGYTLTAP